MCALRVEVEGSEEDGFLLEDKRVQALRGDKQVFSESMPVGQVDDGTAGVFGDSRRDADEGLAEPLPLPAGGLPGQCEQRQPGAQTPSKLSGHQEGAVGQQFAGGHAQGGDAVLELFDDVLLRGFQGAL